MSHPNCIDGRHVCQRATGRTCIEPGCKKESGTPWTTLWCPEHDQERMDRITANLESIARDFPGVTQ